MRLEASGVSDVGMRREKNEDNYLISNNLGLIVVADGMGGHVGGEFASKLAVRTIEDVIHQIYEEKDQDFLNEYSIRKTDYVSQVKLAIELANERIFDEAKKNVSYKGMGTTTVLLMARNSRVYVANVGDSRAYLIRDGKIAQVTQDHSLVGEQVRAGVISQGAAREHKLKNIITRSVGFQQDVEIDVITKVPREGDKFLLCSDGLTNMVEDTEIVEVVGEHTLEEACHILVDMANARGGDDNITVVLCEVADIGGDEETIDIDDESTIGV